MQVLVTKAESRQAKPKDGQSANTAPWYHNISGIKCRRDQGGGFVPFSYDAQEEHVQAVNKIAGVGPNFSPCFCEVDVDVREWRGGAMVRITSLEVLTDDTGLGVAAGGLVVPAAV